jgi:ferrous iron transport protein B
MDEAEGQGMSLDLEALEGRLGIPVVGTVSTSGRGLGRLREILAAYIQPDAQLRCCH